MLYWPHAARVLSASAQTVENFYRGRSVKLVVSAAPGGGADLHARVLVRHLGKHIPGHPTFVVQHVPGAAGLLAATQLQNSVPADGSVVSLLQRNNLLEPLLAYRDVGFDPRKVSWVGSLNKDTFLFIHTSGIRTPERHAKETDPGQYRRRENLTFPIAQSNPGTKFKFVHITKECRQRSMERGEVHGRGHMDDIARRSRGLDHAELINYVSSRGIRNFQTSHLRSSLQRMGHPNLFELMFATRPAVLSPFR
jgi:hypothetical protein